MMTKKSIAMQILYANPGVFIRVGVNVHIWFSSCTLDHAIRRICLNEPLPENARARAWTCIPPPTHTPLSDQCRCVYVWVSTESGWDEDHYTAALILSLPPKPLTYMLTHWMDNAADVPGAKFTLNIINGHLWSYVCMHVDADLP